MTLALKHHHKQRIKKNRIKYNIIDLSRHNKRYVGKAIKTPSFCHCIYCRKDIINDPIKNKRLDEIIKFEMSEL